MFLALLKSTLDRLRSLVASPAPREATRLRPGPRVTLERRAILDLPDSKDLRDYRALRALLPDLPAELVAPDHPETSDRQEPPALPAYPASLLTPVPLVRPDPKAYPAQ